MFRRWGRINRATYAVTLLFVAGLFGVSIGFQFRVPGEVLLAFIFIPRLHDIGRSGWWFGLVILLEVVVALAIVLVIRMEALAAALALMSVAVPAIILACIPGDQGDNRFGKAPPGGFGGKMLVKT